MNALITGRVAGTLDRLHREAEEADRELMAEVMAGIAASGQTVESRMAELVAQERTDYRAVYRDHANRFLSVSPEYGRFLYAIARASKATRIVEFGTSMGVSTIYLAAALRDNGSGYLIGSELEPTKAARARAHLEEAGLADLVEVREGDALDTLKDVGGDVGMLLIDGAWSLYLPVLRLLEPRLTRGAVILGENAFDADYLAYVRNAANGYVSLPLAVNEGRGNEFTVRAA
jgi:predicted O-methyltransferase YrrM